MKAEWELIATVYKSKKERWDIAYSKSYGQYRISLFKQNRFQNDCIFNEVNKNNIRAGWNVIAYSVPEEGTDWKVDYNKEYGEYILTYTDDSGTRQIVFDEYDGDM